MEVVFPVSQKYDAISTSDKVFSHLVLFSSICVITRVNIIGSSENKKFSQAFTKKNLVTYNFYNINVLF